MLDGLGPSQKKSHFVPQNDNFGCILTQFLTVQKLSKNSLSNQRGVGRHTIATLLNIGLVVARYLGPYIDQPFRDDH